MFNKTTEMMWVRNQGDPYTLPMYVRYVVTHYYILGFKVWSSTRQATRRELGGIS